MLFLTLGADMTRPSRMGGKTSEAKARNASPAKGRKTTKTKHRIAPAATRVKRRSVSGPSKDLKEAREQQAATAEILKVIASSPGDVQPVFEAIAQSANRLLGGFSTAVFRFVDHVAHLAAFTPTTPAADRVLQSSYPMPPPNFEQFELAKKGQPVQTPDIEQMSNRRLKEIAQLRGFRSMLFVPLMNSGIPIGFISVTRLETGSFAAHHVELLQTFADQAVIAIENARLFNETQEALKYQTATSEVLQVIGRSMTDAQPVFERILDSTERLFDCRQVGIFHAPGDGLLHCAARRGTGYEAIDKLYPQPIEQTAAPRVLGEGRQVYFPDVMNGVDVPSSMRRVVQVFGNFSVVMTPMIWEGQGIGQISVLREPNASFTPKELSLLRTFADQAVIAIENVRLFNETKEALERQTATADILKVIASSPSDVQPVFEAIAASANRLIGGFSTAVFRFVDGVSHLAAFTPTHPAADEVLKASFPRPLAEFFQPFELALKGEAVQIADTEATSDARIKDIARARGFRSMLFSPLMSNGEPIGLISVTRKELGTFAAHHVQLLQTFADTAVIAIENARLFDEVQAKTSDLSEALQQQIATADVLKVISRSAFDLETVMNTLTRSASELCGADLSGLFLRDGDLLTLRGISDIDVKVANFLRQAKVEIDDQSYMGRAVLSGTIANVPDFSSDTTSRVRTFQQAIGFKAMLTVPLMREGRGVGVFALCRNRVGAFSERQIELVQTFADQAVIAIENVRLFDEVQARTEDLRESLQQQTATADVLKVISRSTFDLQTVLQTLVESAARLCDADKATITRQKDGAFFRAETYGFSDEFMEYARTVPVVPDRGSAIGRALLEGIAVHIPDVRADPDYTFTEGQRLGGFRTILGVPMLREGEPPGVIALTRSDARPFTGKQIELATTFADQAAIAIENVRLFDEVEAKTRDLSEALVYQTGSGNILSVIASSPTDIGPVLKAIVESACELCDAYDAIVRLKAGNDLNELHPSAHHGPMPVSTDKWPINRNSAAGRSVLDKKPVHLNDIKSAE